MWGNILTLSKGIEGSDAFSNSFPQVVKPHFLNLGKREHDETPTLKDYHVTWIGHSTFLIETNPMGVNVLVDPVFSERTSPLPFMGPRRLGDLPCTVRDLPPVHVVLISHNHYDHLDRESIDQLWDRFGWRDEDHTAKGIRFFVPLGLKRWFRKEQQHAVREMDWWGINECHSSVKIHCVPAQHWSMRTGPWDRNASLWCGFVVEFSTADTIPRRVYYSGDSGYCHVFQEIGAHFPGGMDMGLIPIGAYEPRWFMRPHHFVPEESVAVALETGCRQALAAHWGTFPLTSEPVMEPTELLHKALVARGLDKSFFVPMQHGETRIIPAAQY